MPYIKIKSTSNQSAQVQDIILRETKTTRLIFRPLIVDNIHDKKASIKGWFIFQKKSARGNWEDYNTLHLSKLKDREWIKLELKSAEIKILFDNLQVLKSIYEKYGIIIGERNFHITDKNISAVVSQLAKLENKDLIIQELGKLSNKELANLSDSFLLTLQIHKRKQSINEFRQMLNSNVSEQYWQQWFQENPWVLGTEFVEILDERQIDTQHIADYLMRAYDGFLDIVEIKRPGNDIKFWSKTKDHGNLIPSTSLVKAITQSIRYIYEVEREANNIKFLQRTNNTKVVKPRCVLIFGRSNNWSEEEKEAYRILNSSYHNLTILTYDHVLSRANKMLEVEENIKDAKNIHDDYLPF